VNLVPLVSLDPQDHLVSQVMMVAMVMQAKRGHLVPWVLQERSDLLDHLECLASLGKEVYLEFLELLVSKVKWVLKVQLEIQVTKVQLEFLVLVGHKVLWVKQDHVDHEEALAVRESQETKDSPDPPVVMVFQDLEVSQVLPDLLVCLEKMETKEKKDHQEKRALREAKVIQVQMVLLVHRACVVPRVQLEHQESVDHLVF